MRKTVCKITSIDGLSRLVRAYFEGMRAAKNTKELVENPYVKSRKQSEYKQFNLGLKAGSYKITWKAGDKFQIKGRNANLWRVHRTSGRKVWYVPAYYGCCPPRGTLRMAYGFETDNWVKKI